MTIETQYTSPPAAIVIGRLSQGWLKMKSGRGATSPSPLSRLLVALVLGLGLALVSLWSLPRPDPVYAASSNFGQSPLLANSHLPAVSKLEATPFRAGPESAAIRPPAGALSPNVRLVLTGPVLIGPVFTATGEVDGDLFGFSVASAGDVNSDGYTDILVGAFGHPTGADVGRVYLYQGGSLSPTLVFSASGEDGGDYFGAAVASAGDVNGDGFADIMIGASGYPSRTTRGRLYLYHGSSSGLTASPVFTASGENNRDVFGVTLAPAGDVNGDGFADVLVGATGYPAGDFKGRVYLYHGSSSGLSKTLVFSVAGENGADFFGYALSSAGDVNGDGYADVLVGAFGHPTGANIGRVYLYQGSSSGLSPSPVFTATGQNEDDYFGRAVASAGDVNGDGYADVLVGAPGFETNRGQVYLYLGSGSGLNPTPVFTATGASSPEEFGRAVASAGDVNGDGYADVLVGAPGYPRGYNRGQVYLYLGNSSGLSPTPVFTATGESDGDIFGRPVAPAGDINGDGLADFVVGASALFGSGPGRVYLYQGGQ